MIHHVSPAITSEVHFVSHPPLPAHSPLTKCELFAHFVARRAHSAVCSCGSRAGLSQSIRAAHVVESKPPCTLRALQPVTWYQLARRYAAARRGSVTVPCERAEPSN